MATPSVNRKARSLLDWKSGNPYDEIRSAREEFLASEIDRVRREFGAVQCPSHPFHYITKDGEVFSTLCRKLTKLSQGVKPSGYKFVGVGGKKYEMVHRLVALTFLPNPNNFPQVNHKDWDKGNNQVSNLEWVDGSLNMTHSFVNPNRRKGIGSYHDLTDDQIHDIKYGPGTYREVGARNGISSSLVCSFRGKGKALFVPKWMSHPLAIQDRENVQENL